MPVETDSDRAVFVSTDGHGVLADFTIGGRLVPKVSGISDAEHFQNQFGDQVVDGSQPMIEVRTIDVRGVRQGDTWLVDGVVYQVTSVQPDSTGMTTIRGHAK